MSILEFDGIVKRFPGVLALDHISFKAKSGEVTALVGENGAGKSTLLKVLNGDYHQDEGKYLVNNEEKNFSTPQQAIADGIGVVYQERQVVPGLSVAENVFMENMPTKKSRFIDFKILNSKTQEIIDEFKLPFKATDQVGKLSVAYQQMVEIMKNYRREPKIIAFDEPTASLSDNEIEILFEIIRKLKKENVIILYVSHRMDEIFKIAEEVVVLKDGKFIEQLKVKDTNEMEIIRKMVGRDLGDVFNSLDRDKKIGEVVLEVKNLQAPMVRDVSFKLHAGEVLGFSGLVGAGRTEAMRLIFGVDKKEKGSIFIDGKEVAINATEDAIKLGIGLCSEDRKEEGIFASQSVKNNISVAMLDKLVKGIFIDKEKEIQIAEKQKEKLNIKTPDIYKPIGELSGGNQQKAILGRWLATQPRILILDEPTKGIDVGAKAEIYHLICEMAKAGIGVIFISSELPEIMGVSDRIIVMCQGHITGEVMGEEATDEKLLTLAMQDMLGDKGEEE